MILDRLENCSLYAPLAPRLQRAFDYLLKTDLSLLAPGRHDIVDSQVFAIVQQFATKDESEGFWEAHRQYIDVQYVVEGTEKMGFAPLSSLRIKQPYDADKDFVMLDGAGDWLTVASGMFAIFFPHDAHMPGLAVDAPAHVRKVVVKVAV